VTDQQSTLSSGHKTVNSAADRQLDNGRFLDALKKIVGPRHVLTSPSSTPDPTANCQSTGINTSTNRSAVQVS
jgi:hypothetical protein